MTVKVLRVTAIVIVCLASACMVLLAFAYVVDPFDIGDECQQSR